jgi:hypothetical protein
MERIMRSHALGDSRAMEYMKGRKILEVNPEHEIVRGIKVRLRILLGFALLHSAGTFCFQACRS